MSFHCVYFHCRPSGKPFPDVFYVGKASNKKRPHLLKRNNRWHTAIVAKEGAENITVEVAEVGSEAEAFALEKEMIRAFRADDVKLCNLTDGGQGAKGLKQTEEHRRKISERALARNADPEFKAKFRELIKQQRSNSPEFSERMRAVALRQWADPEFRAKAMIRAELLKHDEVHREHSRRNTKKLWENPAHRELMSRKMKGRKFSAETIAKMRASRIAYVQRMKEAANVGAP